MFVSCLFYANDIVLVTPSCRGLQRLVNVRERFAITWDIKFNPAKSELITFGDKNPQLHLNGLAISWADKVKYLVTYILMMLGYQSCLVILESFTAS